MTATRWTWLVIVAVYGLFFSWYTSFGGPLSDEEIAHYMALMESRETPHVHPVPHLAYTPDGRRLVTFGVSDDEADWKAWRNPPVRSALWDVRTGGVISSKSHGESESDYVINSVPPGRTAMARPPSSRPVFPRPMHHTTRPNPLREAPVGSDGFPHIHP